MFFDSTCESPHSALWARSGPWRRASVEGGYAVGLWPALWVGILRRCCRGRCLGPLAPIAERRENALRSPR